MQRSSSHSNPVSTWKLNKRKIVKQVSAFSALRNDFIIKFSVLVEGKVPFSLPCKFILKRFVTLFILSMLSPFIVRGVAFKTEENFSTPLPIKRIKQVAKALLH